MAKYRIKKVTDPDIGVYYTPQFRKCFIWCSCLITYDNEESARNHINMWINDDNKKKPVTEIIKYNGKETTGRE